jgi:hypothetical protein
MGCQENFKPEFTHFCLKSWSETGKYTEFQLSEKGIQATT